LGGKDKLAAVKSIAYKADSVRSMGGQEIEVQTTYFVEYPDRFKTTMNTPQGELSVSISPAESVMSMGGQSRPVPLPMKEEALNGIRRDVIWVAQHADDPKYVFRSLPPDGNLAVLDINADGIATRWFIDPQSGRIARSSAKAQTMQGTVLREIEYDDYRPVNGV